MRFDHEEGQKECPEGSERGKYGIGPEDQGRFELKGKKDGVFCLLIGSLRLEI